MGKTYILPSAKSGYSREVTDLGNGDWYVCDSRIVDGKYEYHEYNVYHDGTHTHVHGIMNDGDLEYLGGHGEERRPWSW